MVDGLADIVQQARPGSKRHVGAHLGGHDAGQMRHLDGVVQHVLAVAGAVLHAAQIPDELMVQPMDAHLQHGGFAGLTDLVADLLLGLLHHLLDAGGVDAAVHDQLLEGDPGDLPADRVEGGEDHGLGRVVDDQVHAGGGLEGPDVPALAADDPALHLVVGQRHHGHGGLRHMVGGAALDSKGDDVPRLPIGLLLGLLLDVTEQDGGVVLGLLLHAGEEHLLGGFHGEPGDPLQLLFLLLDQRLGVGFPLLHLGDPLVHGLFPGLHGLDLLVQGLLPLEEPALGALQLVPTVPILLLGLGAELVDLLLGLQFLFLTYLFRFLLCIVQQGAYRVLGLRDLGFRHVLAVEIADQQADEGTRQGSGDQKPPVHRFTPIYKNITGQTPGHNSPYHGLYIFAVSIKKRIKSLLSSASIYIYL